MRTMTEIADTVLCMQCGSVFEQHTERTTMCTVCQRFRSLSKNSNRVRRDGHAPGLEFTLQQFAVWFACHPRKCVYCTIHESLIKKLNLTTQVGKPLQRLGVDRTDNDLPYTVTNIVLCCYACNKVRSNTFTADEMKIIGPSIASTWVNRLSANSTEVHDE